MTGDDPAGEAAVDGGSYRDRSSKVFYHEGAVLRALDARAAANWERLAATRFFANFTGRGRLIPTQRRQPFPTPLPAGGDWAAVLEHERVPFVSYPYEWSFGMLRDAALLHLQLLAAALEEGMVLKDSSAYNLQWIGTRPVFIDIPSFEPLAAGETWVGYRQFCMMFLYPLMLQAYRGAPFQPWLRGAIDGIEPEEMAALLGRCALWRRGVLTHVFLHARLQRKESLQRQDTRENLRRAGFSAELIKANVKGLHRLVARLRWKPAASTWSGYGDSHSYAADDYRAKLDFVKRAAARRHWPLVWDLGGNTGEFSEIVAAHADAVVLMDGDALAVECAYQRLRDAGAERILPLCIDLSDPSPGRGWRGAERKALNQRGRPDLVLALALVHHLVIGANIPLSQVVDWLADLGAAVVVEFVTREDEMVQQMLRNREDQFSDYDLAAFEALLPSRFSVVERNPLKDGRRVIYFLQPSRRPDG